ncbi:MAG: N,N-dimethylformamidase [Burkholderiales bacterium]|nr:N,N-dimethylformamidase [Burkholderiales bacterium]
MLKITGYSDKLSIAPGETMSFMVSSEMDLPYRAELVRVIHGDCNPQGPGVRFERLALPALEGLHPGRRQATDGGSWLGVPTRDAWKHLEGFSFFAVVCPTTPHWGPQTIASWEDAEDGRGFRLELDAEGHLCGSASDGTTTLQVRSEVAVAAGYWLKVMLALDPQAGELRLVQAPVQAVAVLRHDASAVTPGRLGAIGHRGDLLMAGRAMPGQSLRGQPRVDVHFNGKIDSPLLLDHALDARALDSCLLRPLAPVVAQHVIGRWDFSLCMTGTEVVDAGPLGLNGRLHQLPTRAMKGWNWTGEHHDWKLRPDHYGAIHFHEDDLYDCGWETSLRLTIPKGTRSAPWALRVWVEPPDEAARAEVAVWEDFIPFFVRPPRGTAGRSGRPSVVFLAPTASYLAYANSREHLHADAAEMVIGRLLNYSPSDVWLHDHRELGLSLYDVHSDDSGVSISSGLRPILNMRPKHHNWLGGHGSGLWQYNADTQLFDWLEHERVDYDVITDEDLHRDGAEALAPYRVVLTGTHPEYHSTAMWNAMQGWLDKGGRLMYLGANGWYWRIAYHGELPNVVELRRAEDGIRTWMAEPGEYHHSFSGEFGGLWRRIGRNPNKILGVGFTAQGFDVCSYYRRQPDSHDPRAAFIFEGVGDELIGNFGLVGGGAAGLELDRVEFKLGTPLNTLKLASSEGHTDLIQLVNEEFGVVPPNLRGSEHEWVRADLAFFETPAGGAVFSTGSIAWCGSLSHNGYDNNVARITGNVLRRFNQADSFAPPRG